MDPLSAAGSIVGLIGVTATTTRILKTFINTVKNAPDLAKNVLAEVTEISACLTQLQAFLLGTKVMSRSRASLLMVEQIIVALTNCVMIFSELDKILDMLRPDQSSLSARSKMKFAIRAPEISSILARLRTSKASLNLMLMTLDCASTEEAQAAVEGLAMLVRQVVETNQDISRRLGDLNIQSDVASCNFVSASCATANSRDKAFQITSERSGTTEDLSLGSSPTISFGFTFEKDLQGSRVYKKIHPANRTVSPSSSVIGSVGSSLISGLSLADISSMSAISLPIARHEIWNPLYYAPKPCKIVNFSRPFRTTAVILSRRSPEVVIGETIRETIREIVTVQIASSDPLESKYLRHFFAEGRWD